MNLISRTTAISLIVMALAISAFTQTTEFTYQGSLQNSSAPANGNFDFEFALFDALSGGTQLGATLTRSTVAVTAGTFAVKLDFGGQFPGANRFLEIRVRQTGGGAFTPLAPRQSVGSSPYSVQSLNASNATTAITANTATNATQLGGVAANQYVVTTDSRMTDARPPTAGSANYVQNQNAAPQSSSNFNISGTGTADIFNAATQFNINGSRILGNQGNANLFAGFDAGAANTTGSVNSFFGRSAGQSNLTGDGNSFFGTSAGNTNTSGSYNSFFGRNAGVANSSANNNSFFGAFAGNSNSIGTANSYFGANAGQTNSTASENSFFGAEAGLVNLASGNSFFGRHSGLSNTIGAANSFFGIGSGGSNTSGGNNSFFGSESGLANTTGAGNSFFGRNTGITNTTGSNNTIIGNGANVSSAGLNFATAIGAGAVVSTDNTIVLGRGIPNDTVQVPGNLTVSGAFSANLNAGSITSGTLSNARLGQIPTANIADGAVTAAKISSGQVVKAINGLQDNVTLAAGSNIAITPAGNTLTVAFTGGNPILNQTTPQSGANFNISGNGTAGGTLSGNIVNAASQYNIGGSRILSNAGTDNLFAGVGAGQANTAGFGNAFFGVRAGGSNTSGAGNAFYGLDAGTSNTTGGSNTFFGLSAGFANTTGSINAFFGSSAGRFNTTGVNNAFFGREAGYATTSGFDNAFFGGDAGDVNTTGFNNAFFGQSAGDSNTTGDGNTIIGKSADVASGGLTNATAIGAFAQVAQNNSVVLGSINGVNGATSDTNVGIGTTTPNHRLTVGTQETPVVTTATLGVYGAGAAFTIVRDTTNNVEALFGADSGGALYGSVTNHPAVFRTNNANRMIIAPAGEVAIVTLGAAGATALCRNASNQISTCSSSARYKNSINTFSSGLDLIRRLRPVSFNWTDGGLADLGLVAEEVAAAEPLLTTTNAKGEVEGVKYDRVAVVAVNAINEQQSQIDALTKRVNEQKEENRRLQAQIDQLKRLICRAEQDPEICKVEN